MIYTFHRNFSLKQTNSIGIFKKKANEKHVSMDVLVHICIDLSLYLVN